MRFMFAIKTVFALALAGLVAATPLSAQQAEPGAIAGQVTQQDGAPLAAARVAAQHTETGLEYGAVSEDDGRYRIDNLRPGLYTVEVRVIGYDVGKQENIEVTAGATTEVGFTLGTEAVALDALEVFSTRAIERVTPVAYSDIDKEQMEKQLGSQDIPIVLNVTPSVYATEQGGGAGDARINVRGFDQRNVAVMINGVPVNDMENGWVYWSNWDGVGDATSSIQLQRGLSAVNLATPSIGGTLNIITDATKLESGGMVKQEFGSDGFLKTTARVATGQVGDFAFMGQGVFKDGDGIPNGAWTTGWAYYLGASWVPSATNRLDLFALGAPQRHGQRLYAQNIGAFDREFALSLDSYDPAAADAYPESPDGHDFNQNFNSVDPDYDGQQATYGDTFDRKLDGFLNERENFYHKPQVNLNWYSQFAPDLSLSTVAYYSGGKGGGTGTLGDFAWDYSSQPTRIPDWNANIAINRGTVDGDGEPKPAGESLGILRNSNNRQWTIGLISKLRKEFDSPLTMEVGADWRTAEIDHFRDVRDLLGGDYYVDDSNEFTGPRQTTLGDKVAYNFTNTVDWLGGYVQGEYSTPEYTVYGMGGLSMINYTYTNHFRMDDSGGKIESETDNITGYQLKGGGLLNVSENVGVYVNGGYVSKVPIFDAVIDDFAGIVNPDPQNEKFISFEGGVNVNSPDRSLAASFNAYFTQWKDRTQTRGYTDAEGNDVLVSLLGMDQRHMGLEAELSYRASSLVQLDVAGSLANWKYTDDVSGTVRPSEGAEPVPFDFYVNDLKVGDAPQLQASAAVSVFPSDGLFLQVVGKTYGNHYAAFDPFDRDDPTDRTQSWKAPGYAVFDLHGSYTFPESMKIGDLKIFAHAFNIFDNTYILDATDNSSFNSFDQDHDADDAEVNLGLGTRFNAGVQIGF